MRHVQANLGCFSLDMAHLSLPEIKDFNALGDSGSPRINAKSYGRLRRGARAFGV
jgi:hypothetical protein